MRRRSPNMSGFTIIELMIATAVFSVVLLLLATGVITVTRQYVQGINESHTQDVARNISNTIAQALQFDGATYTAPGTPFNDTYGAENRFCLGNERYSYLLGKELEDTPTSGQTPDALVEDSSSACNSSPPLNFTAMGLPAGATELLSANMRLDNLEISSPSPNTYNICVRVVYGADSSIAPFTPTTDLCGGTPHEHQCLAGGILDFAFCAVSELDTTVQQRVTGS